MPTYDFDVIIAGGSVAGVAAAAAVREFGWSVLIVEPGQRSERRLAGELIHPAGVAGLRELGLFEPNAFAAAASILGFIVFPEAGDAGQGIRLPYGRDQEIGETALALDYCGLRQSLQTSARALAHVTFLDGARVVAVDHGPAASTVTIEEAGIPKKLTCRLLVAADGASSPVRALAGIAHSRRAISTISGYVVNAGMLPAPGFGHVFIGGPAVVLAYEIGGGRARIMFDQPVDQRNVPAGLHRETLLGAIPTGLRRDVSDAVAIQRPLSFVSAEVVAATTTRGTTVLVGDAGGSCHPLTATGMTIGIRDGLRLRDALRDHDGRVPAALVAYNARRRIAQRSRRLVASALHDTCSRREPEHRLLRAGLIRYWTQDVTSQQASMAILAMTDDRIGSAFWQLFKVMRHGFADHWARERSSRIVRLGMSAKLVAALGVLALKQLRLSASAR